MVRNTRLTELSVSIDSYQTTVSLDSTMNPDSLITTGKYKIFDFVSLLFGLQFLVVKCRI